jgi:hypothetical protein
MTDILGLRELKAQINISPSSVECPVKDCQVQVERQKKRFQTESKYQCPTHKIFISPSTFEYPEDVNNLLWKEKDDLDLLNNIKTVKRESRMARDNSEDAATWNVFRFLEKHDLIKTFMNRITGEFFKEAEVIYWSYSQAQQNSWGILDQARDEFGEKRRRSSEPDLIIKTDKALIFVEAKLGAGNKTKPSKLEDRKRYETGGQNWFAKAFRSEYETITVKEQKYELMRFWLLGTWMANQLGTNFFLLNLVLKEREQDIEEAFKKHIVENPGRQFKRITWEDIYVFVSGTEETSERDILLDYFVNKSLGYSNGALKKAFSVF